MLLSAGEDGHVGALFPRHHSVEDRHHGFIVMDDSPKPPPGRMTSSLSLMQTASAAVLIFAGEAKREAYARFNDTSCPVADCPAKLVLAIGDRVRCSRTLCGTAEECEKGRESDHEEL